jgi:hypothetical protein
MRESKSDVQVFLWFSSLALGMTATDDAKIGSELLVGIEEFFPLHSATYRSWLM